MRITVIDKVPAGTFSLGALFLTVVPGGPRETYFIARISTGGLFSSN
jgi:hypothetical protein